MAALGPARLVVVDKPAGPTSFDVVKTVRRATRMRRVGHGGTLDPFATGVLVVATGAATRLLNHLAHGGKTYRMDVCFGVGTDSHDATGVVVEEAEVRFDPADLSAAVRGFEGRIEQQPPSLSAIRVDGERAYVRHRRDGATADLTARPVEIHGIEVVGVDLPLATLRVRCGGGTYMRALARDLGRTLGCPAHAATLRREAVGPFTLDDAVPPDTLADRWPDGPGILRPLELTRHWAHLTLSPEEAQALRQGRQPEPEWTQRVEGPAGPVGAECGGDLVAVLEPTDPGLRIAMVLPEGSDASP